MQPTTEQSRASRLAVVTLGWALNGALACSQVDSEPLAEGTSSGGASTGVIAPEGTSSDSPNDSTSSSDAPGSSGTDDGELEDSSSGEPPSGPVPTYVPFFVTSFEGGSAGQMVADFVNPTTPMKLSYSDEIAGPFGDALVARQENQATNKNFGGRIVDVALGKGEQVWVRWFEYLPDDYCFANGTNGDANGGSGKMKWMRFQYPGNSTRVTLQVTGTPSCAAPCSDCMTELQIESIVGEAMGWDNQRHVVGGPGFERGRWHAIQVYMFLDDVPVDAGGEGRFRIWVDDVLLAEGTDKATLDAATSEVRSIWWGNYWNGGFPNDQHWYMDEIVMTSEAPNTLDADGFPYIDPLTRVEDFGA